MEYTDACGLRISGLTLGTVQLGLRYGIANRDGLPSRRQAMNILQAAHEAGINSFDTAPAYGDAEEILGEFLAGTPAVVTTKLPAMEWPDRLSRSEVEGRVRGALQESARRLRIDRLPICLLHGPGDLTAHGGMVAEALVAAKETGLVGLVGASVYTAEEARACIAQGGFDAVQAPISILDRRLVESGVLAQTEEAGVMVFARSVFLQGLVTLAPDDVPPHLSAARPALAILREASRELGVTVTDLALAYALGLSGVTSTVVGVETVAQLRANVRSMGTVSVCRAALSELVNRFPDLPEEVVDPRKWNEEA